MQKHFLPFWQDLTSAGRLLHVAGQRPDAQQVVTELARGMSRPLGSVEARDNDLTATCDRDWGGCVKTRRSTTGHLLLYA